LRHRHLSKIRHVIGHRVRRGHFNKKTKNAEKFTHLEKYFDAVDKEKDDVYEEQNGVTSIE
jgi:hypothetical protein